MRICLIVNDASGTGPDAERLAARLGAQVVLGVADVERAAGHAPDRIVVAGGDGSLGPAAAAAVACGADLAVVPSGTANDFARDLGLPEDEDEALALAADPAAATAEVDLARADGRPFLNVASFGLAAGAARAAEGLKGVLGPAAYAAGAAAAGATGEPFTARVTVDGEPVWDGAAWQVIVAGTGAFGGGAGLDAARRADGMLDVAVVPEGPRAGLLRRAAGLRRGNLTEQEGVVHARGRVVTVAAADTAANVDGEVCDPAPVTLETGRERVRVVVP